MNEPKNISIKALASLQPNGAGYAASAVDDDGEGGDEMQGVEGGDQNQNQNNQDNNNNNNEAQDDDDMAKALAIIEPLADKLTEVCCVLCVVFGYV